MLDTLSTKLVVLATTVTGACSDALANVREFAGAMDKLVWAAMVWHHEWTTAGMMAGDRGRTGRYSWSFWPDPDSSDTVPFSALVDCETGTRNRIYSALKTADMLSECRRTGDRTTPEGWQALCATYGLTSGDAVVAVSGPLARKYGENPTVRDVATVGRWIDQILNPVTDDDSDDKDEDTGESNDTPNGHDLGAVASPTYATAAGLIADAVGCLRLLAADELAEITDDDRAALAANRDELTDELDSINV